MARGRLTLWFLGGVKILDSRLRAFAETAVSFVERYLQHRPSAALSVTFTLSEQVLASLELMAFAAESNLLPAAFNQRLDQFAKSLKRSIKGKPVQPTLAALATLQNHQLARIRKDQVKTAELAVRTCVWMQTENPKHSSALNFIEDYIKDAGYLDWARSRIWAGDEHESVSQAYRQLTKQVSERRERLNQAFSHHLPAIARGDQFGDGIFAVESALDELVAPLSKQQQVLLLVLDGMSQAVYRELADDLIQKNWVELQRDGAKGPGGLVAALPTITNISRYSLLAGSIGEGASVNEKKAFASHQALKSLASTKFPPRLFHKGDLQQIGSGALAANVREVIAGREHRIVGVVINAVDDQLSSGAQLAVNWSVESVSLLRQILEAARESTRLLIFTSDHGHVLDHDMQYTRTSSDAERFKQAMEKTGPGEILVEGRRVVQPGHKVILPWSEKIRYTQKKMGYHGGGSPQEVIIPVGVYKNAGERDSIEGWHEVPHQEPSWWQLEAVSMGVAEEIPKPTIRTIKRSKKDNRTADLFEQLESEIKKSPADEDWIACLFASPVYAQMKSRVGRVIISEDQLQNLLRLLVERGGQQMIGALVQALGIPSIRINGFLAGVQKLLNVDGYPVLSIDRTTKTVKLNIESLKTQFEL